MNDNGNNGTALREWDNAHVWHPFTPMQAYQTEGAPIIERADGFWLFDTSGSCFLDGTSSLWCNVHGHRVPEIDAAIREQLDRVAHSTLLGLSGTPSIELARELVRVTPPGLNRVFYSDSGATSVEVAIKLAYQYQQQRHDGARERDLFVCVGNAYHGDTVGTVSVGAIDLFHSTYRSLLFEKAVVPCPVAYRVPAEHTADSWLQHCSDEVERVVRQHHERIAGFVMEPLVQGAGGILVHPPGYLRHVRELTREFDIPLIADEVAVGFGRTGTLFACEQEDVQPDMMCLAKGITGGYLPLAATLTTDTIFEAFLGEPHAGRTFYHGHTYTGNPLAAAAALSSLRLFEERDLLARIRKNENTIRDALAILSDHPHVGEVRQKGIMVGIELVQDRDSKTAFPAARRTGHLVTLAARERGTIIRPLGDTVVLMPAPAMPSDLVTQLCETAIDAITAATS